MYSLINFVAVFLGGLSVFLLLRRERLSCNKAVLLSLLLFASIICFGIKIEPNLETRILKIGFSSIRGIIGACFALVVVYKWQQKQFSKYLKAVIVSLPLMYSVAKLACLYVGCCHGFEYNGLFAIVHDSVGYFPIQPLETLAFAIIYIIGILVYLKRKKLYWLPYAALSAKFVLDFCRAERDGLWLLSWNQTVIIILLILWTIYLKRKRQTQKETN